jgi:alpha-amylase
MTAPTSLGEIDLSPVPGKTYFTLGREWREEFIYFVVTDRFHDGNPRTRLSQTARSVGFPASNDFYGGTIKGITQNLDYIAGLGCTAIWLTPVFENNPGGYHGYDINNYLDIDPHFGTKQDLVDLVNAAHAFVRNGEPWPMRVILDVVTNHSGDIWVYPGDFTYNYFNGQQFDFGGWRRTDRPIPIELQNADYYHRCGSIGNYDAYPELLLGDIASLKDFANDDTAIGSAVVNALIKAHCYWIREADVDGFRMDAVKHMGDVACAWFTSNVREYAYSLGKREFFLFGEVATPSDDIYNGYLGPNTSVQDNGGTVYFGLDSVLDFRLAEGVYGDSNNGQLRDVILGNIGPQTLFNRIEAQRERALNRGELGRYLVTFVDNHDSFWQPNGRIGASANDDQAVAAIGFLLCALGTACIYYGTEQGFSGRGGDAQMREAMFDSASGGICLMNQQADVYQRISQIGEVVRNSEPLRFGRMYYRQISGNHQDFGLPFGTDYTLAFSRLLYGSEVLVAYNVSSSPRSDGVIVDADVHPSGSILTFRYGGTGTVTVQPSGGANFVTLNLAPHAFVILS